jgi:Ca2+-binding RTX toxin-like protein
MTDDANGDALFVDDVYSAFPDKLAAQSRIAQINEIRAGAGDDIVDLTSQRFVYVGDGLTVYGGSGDDTIWATSGDNHLFGDAGNDRLVGGSGNDIIVGGIGNDSMHGGGGADTFCFGENWGVDTVEQLADGSVTLWFESGSESNWNASTLTYSDGTNSVTVSGIDNANIILKFGDTASAIAGAFESFASEKIFEDQTKALLA